MPLVTARRLPRHAMLADRVLRAFFFRLIDFHRLRAMSAIMNAAMNRLLLTHLLSAMPLLRLLLRAKIFCCAATKFMLFSYLLRY